MSETTDERIRRLHAPGIVDLHFDLLMDLYEKRNSPGLLVAHYLPEFEAGDIGVIGAAIYIEDRYLPEMALRVALDQVAVERVVEELSDCLLNVGGLRARPGHGLITREAVEWPIVKLADKRP